MKPMPADMRYAPEIFEKNDLAAARDIILRPQPGVPTDTRWERETEWMMERVAFPDGCLIFDIGCGIGRLSKPLVKRGHQVLGVDASQSMRNMALDYVADPRFGVVTPDEFMAAVENGQRAQGAITAWVFQHIPTAPLTRLLRSLWTGLDKGSALYALERPERWIPVKQGGRQAWFNDEVSVVDLLLGEGFSTGGITDEPPQTICRPGAQLRRWRK